jgi:hypothetical protein
MGTKGYININLTYLLLWILPVGVFASVYHAVCLTLASTLLALFLREQGVHRMGAALGGIAYAWTGSNLTLTYAGHLPKFAVLVFAAACLVCVEKAVRRRSPAWACLAGGAMGGMFLEIQDMALFFSLVLGPYVLFALWREGIVRPAGVMRLLLPLLVVAGLTAARPVIDGYRTSVKGVASVSDDNPQAKWEFATQWSWPPEESIDFIAPGYMGWRSGDPQGPYWGRMGRSEGWETTRQGFMNFKLESQYLGAVPIVFALFALYAARKQPADTVTGPASGRADVVFWGVAMLVTLLLAFGKHFPLYQVFFALPVVDSIRNPNKFLQVFQLALAVLAGYGLHRALGGHRDDA